MDRHHPLSPHPTAIYFEENGDSTIGECGTRYFPLSRYPFCWPQTLSWQWWRLRQVDCSGSFPVSLILHSKQQLSRCICGLVLLTAFLLSRVTGRITVAELGLQCAFRNDCGEVQFSGASPVTQVQWVIYSEVGPVRYEQLYRSSKHCTFYSLSDLVLSGFWSKCAVSLTMSIITNIIF